MDIKRVHKNSHQNQDPHHLYEILDSWENDDVFKYGVSSDPIEEDGYSQRMRRQVNALNLIDRVARFFARIILLNIPGKKQAEKIEDDYISPYKKIHGHVPRGNPKHKLKNKP